MNKRIQIKYSIVKFFVIILYLFNYTLNYAQQIPKDNIKLIFILNYETFQPLEIRKSVLYISPQKITGISDSIFATYSSSNFYDTIYIDYPWRFPVHAYFVIYFTNEKLISNKFYLDPARINYIVTVKDTSVIIKTKPRYSFDEKKSFLGIILVIQTAIELLLALMFYKIFKWPKWIILAVLFANLASLSVYLLKLHPVYINELAIIGVKLAVLILLGRRKLGFLKIISLVLILNVISFGIKEMLIFLTKLI